MPSNAPPPMIPAPAIPAASGARSRTWRGSDSSSRGGERRSVVRAERAPEGHEAEEALALRRAVEVRHEGPEHGHDEEVEDARPDEEHAADPHGAIGAHRAEDEEEDDEVQDEEPVDERHEPPPREPRDERGEERVQEEHPDEGPREEPGQVGDAPGHAHLVAHGADHVVGGEDEEEVRAGGDERGGLVLPDVDQPAEEPAERPRHRAPPPPRAP